ncbi:MAG: 30S ribosomal protein S8 [Bacteroidota bacterium]
MTDPISDFLTRVRNAQQAGHRLVEIPASKTKKRITEILYDHGYILKYKFEDTADNQGVIKIALKYDATTKAPVIKNLKRISTPGLRQYRGTTELPRVLSGLGIAIVSTSKGVMTEKEARGKGIGGEVLCEVF